MTERNEMRGNLFFLKRAGGIKNTEWDINEIGKGVSYQEARE